MNYRANIIKSLTLIILENVYFYLDVNEKYYKRLFKYLNRYITLSYYNKDIISLLYSFFFESNVLYNLIKTYLFDIRKVIELVRSNLKILFRLITRRNLKLSTL